MHCQKCGTILAEAMIYALLTDLGARLSWNPELCDDGEPHDWVPDDETPVEQIEPVES